MENSSKTPSPSEMDASSSQSKPGDFFVGGGGQETMSITYQAAYNNAATGGSSISVPHEPGDNAPTVVAGASPSPTPVVVAAEASLVEQVVVFAQTVAANITETVKEVDIGPGITLGFHSQVEYSFVIANLPKVDDLHYI